MKTEITKAKEYLSGIIEPTDLNFRMKVKSKDRLYTEDIERKTLVDLLLEFSTLQNKELIEANERLTKQRHTLADENIQYKSELSKQKELVEDKQKQIILLTEFTENTLNLFTGKGRLKLYYNNKLWRNRYKETRTEINRQIQSNTTLKQEIEGLRGELKRINTGLSAMINNSDSPTHFVYPVESIKNLLSTPTKEERKEG